MNRSAIGAGALALAVVLGAFGAHGLKGRVDDYALGIWERAVFYHFVHALGLLVIPLFPKTGMLSRGGANRVAVLLVIGILLFSGSLYVLVLSGVRMLGAITPFGGLAFIAAWLLLAFELWRTKS
jgi:uncharacterized membrane protein YgdD (TMEM256/DUF423 family)